MWGSIIELNFESMQVNWSVESQSWYCESSENGDGDIIQRNWANEDLWKEAFIMARYYRRFSFRHFEKKPLYSFQAFKLIFPNSSRIGRNFGKQS